MLARLIKASKEKDQGFTLIELLVVIVIIGILAAIAIPKFANTKEKAVVASMKSDLRNLVTAQEGFFSDNQDYAGGHAATQTNGVGGAGVVAFGPSANNTVTITVVSATSAGWSAQASAPSRTAQTCVIYYGNAPPIPPATVDGAVACT